MLSGGSGLSREHFAIRDRIADFRGDSRQVDNVTYVAARVLPVASSGRLT